MHNCSASSRNVYNSGQIESCPHYIKPSLSTKGLNEIVSIYLILSTVHDIYTTQNTPAGTALGNTQSPIPHVFLILDEGFKISDFSEVFRPYLL